MGGARSGVQDRADGYFVPGPPPAGRTPTWRHDRRVGLVLVAFLMVTLLFIGIGFFVAFQNWGRGPAWKGLLPSIKPTTVSATYGTTVRLSDGLGQMTVSAPGQPVLVSVGVDGAPVSGELTSFGVTVCSGGIPFSDSLDATDFNLLFAPDTAIIATSFHAKQPDLEYLEGPGSHKCVRGYVTFYTGRGSVPSGFSYRQLFPPVTYRWAPVPQS